MSQSQQQGGQSRQPVSYPSPTSYPSPGMSSSQYSYPAPNNQQVNEPYRASPTGSNGSLSLPSMSSLDPLRQAAHQHMGSPLAVPAAPMGGPYYHSAQTLPHPQHQQYANVTSDPTNAANMRFALPQSGDTRVMSGGRHKKEIKRRTKTGCLTCRKRRIKCDEQHPACRNCQKSKRECLGYDPIFKQQPGPAAIQPAPSSAPSQASTSAPANPYGNQPSMLQGVYGSQVPNMSYEPALSAGVSSPGSASQQFDYPSAIDPALESVGPPTANSANQFQQSPSGMPNFREDLKRELQSASPYSSGASDSPHMRGGASSFLSPSSSQFSNSEENSIAYATSAKGIKMDDLLALSPPIPSLPANIKSSDKLDEIKQLYHSLYSPGLENFLECKWFSGKGLTSLLGANDVLDQLTAMILQFGKTTAGDERAMNYTTGLETRVVWAVAKLAHSPEWESTNGDINTDAGIPTNDDAVETGRRLAVFENLVTRVVADRNALTPPPATGEHHKLRELEFWYHLGKFTTLRDDDVKAIEDTLASLRNLLDGRENRDVLYSIAIVRSLVPRVGEYSDHERPAHLDETDPRSKVAVAKRFVKDEAEGAGTTNVIRRLADLAVRSWTGKPAIVSMT